MQNYPACKELNLLLTFPRNQDSTFMQIASKICNKKNPGNYMSKKYHFDDGGLAFYESHTKRRMGDVQWSTI